MSRLTELPSGGVWTAAEQVWFAGVRLRATMTVLRLADGGLWVHSANEPTPELCAELDRLGHVRWIVVPNRYHHLHASAMKARYRDAQVIGPRSAQSRNEALALDVASDDERLPALVPEVAPVALRGVPFLDETLFFHPATGSLIGADVMMRGCAADHFTWRWASRLFGQFGRYKAPPDVRKNTRGGPEVRQALDEIGKLPVKRILVAHSDPVEDEPLERLREAWSFVRA